MCQYYQCLPVDLLMDQRSLRCHRQVRPLTMYYHLRLYCCQIGRKQLNEHFVDAEQIPSDPQLYHSVRCQLDHIHTLHQLLVLDPGS